MSRPSRATRALHASSALLCLSLARCESLVPAASTAAPRVDRVFYLLLGVSAFFTLVIAGMIFFFGIRYRSGVEARRGRRLRRGWILEATWIGVPALIALGIFYWAAVVYIDLTTPPPGARVIYVVGKQWMWKVHHASGRQEIDTLHVPTGEPVRLLLYSQDVVHSFFVPAFRVKQDVVPGRYTSLWFEATRPGRYLLECSQYCGAGHSDMRGEVVVLPPVEFERWLSARSPVDAVPGTPGTPGAPLAQMGKGAFYRLGCNACHLPGAAVRAPRLDGIYGREVVLRNGQRVIADEQYLRESILDPQAKLVAGYQAPSLMPTYKGQLGEEQIFELIEFIKSIRDGWPEEGRQR